MTKRSAYILALSAFIALGIARFSYALVLPSMRSDLRLSYSAAGSLGTANTAGYFLGSLLLPAAVARWSLLRVFRVGVLVTALAIFLTGATHWYPLLLTTRALAGFGGAGAFILGSAIAATLSLPRGDAVVVFNVGAGLGVIVSGATLPSILGHHAERWPVAWFALGAVALASAAAVLRVRWPSPGGTPARVSLRAALVGVPSLHWLTAAYACFGAGYIVYVTFLIATLRANGATAAVTSVAFVTLGVMTILSPRIWRSAIARWSSRQVFAATMLCQAAGAALLALSGSTAAVLGSVVIFGSAFLLTPALVTMTVRDQRPPAAWPSTIGAITAVFALTQAVSPWISGLLIDRFGTSAGPMWTLLFSLLGAFCAIAIRA